MTMNQRRRTRSSPAPLDELTKHGAWVRQITHVRHVSSLDPERVALVKTNTARKPDLDDYDECNGDE